MTKAEFEALSPYEKGYAVYWAGHRDDQPNIPERFEPMDGDREEYERGQFAAVLDAQDSEE